MTSKEIKKKNVFSEWQINTINIFALIISYILMGFLLNSKSDFFGDYTRTIIISLISLGIFGLFTEIRRINYLYGIRGLAEEIIGIFMFLVYNFTDEFLSPVGHGKFVSFSYEVLLCLSLFIVLFCIVRGFIKIFWSTYISYNRKFKNKRKDILVTRILFGLVECIGILLIYILLYRVLF